MTGIKTQLSYQPIRIIGGEKLLLLKTSLADSSTKVTGLYF